MYLSLDWLKDFVKIPKNISPADLGLRLTMHTVEIDNVIEQSERLKKVVVGKVKEIKKHPQADKLYLVKVDIGREGLEIVCGADNFQAGDLVPVALTGAVLPNGMEIKATVIRGVKSNGMLCAADELGLGSDHSGIMILKSGRVGQNLSAALGLDDVIFEVDNKSITHRPDLWSHYGMAREISSFLNTRMAVHIERMAANKIKIGKSKKLNVEVKDFKLCPRYMAIQVDNVKIEDSPGWMQKRLLAVGMRPINNIVDITNYVMLELGQPLHAFDAALIATNIKTNSHEFNIVVRRARRGEKIETLDGQKRELDEEMLVIANKDKPIGIAGVMGGANSEIGQETKSIVIESANFESTQIRKTAQKLGLRTEASIRYEKSLDPNLCASALARVLELIKKICPRAQAASNLVDEKKYKLNQGPIELSLEMVNNLAGEKIDEKRIINILTSLGFGVKKKSAGTLACFIPSWRATRDISIPEDLVEEIARIYGYDNLEPRMPNIVMAAPEFNQERTIERKIKNILALGAGLIEVYNYSFVGEAQLKRLKIDYTNHVELANPIASHQTLLRQSLIPNLFENVKLNQARYENFGLFEIGSIFLNSPGEINKNEEGKEKLPYQERHLGIIMAGGADEDIFFRLKGIIEYLLSRFGFEIEFVPGAGPAWAQAGATAGISLAGKNVGFLAGADNYVCHSAGIKKQVAGAEISLPEFYEALATGGARCYEPLPKYPAVRRDLAFVVDSKVLYNDIKAAINNFSALIKTVELFDVYQGEKLGRGKKNLAFHIAYQSPDYTLTAGEVDELQSGLVKHLEQKFKAQIRDF